MTDKTNPKVSRYWVWLEPYVHVFVKNNHGLIYNTLSGAKLEYKDEAILRILVRFLDKENLLVIEMTGEELEPPAIKSFIRELRDTFSGDLSSAARSKERPAQLMPIPGNHADIEKMKRNPVIAGKALMSYLSELTLYITSSSCIHHGQNQGLFSMLYTQFPFPCIAGEGESETELPVPHIERILTEARESGIYALNIAGGDLFLHSEWEAVYSLLESFPVVKSYYAHYRDFVRHLSLAHRLKEEGSRIHLSVTLPVEVEAFEEAVRFARTRESVTFCFAVSGEDEFEEAEQLVSRYNLERVQFMPYYNGRNLEFFEAAVFYDRESIQAVHPTQKEIFRRMSMNPNDFGKLTVMSDGAVYANLNLPSIGRIPVNSLREIMYNELVQGESWFKSRTRVTPCDQCVYNLLCPPLTNYEYVLGRNNLCSIYEEEC